MTSVRKANPAHIVFQPGQIIPAKASAAITGKRFVKATTGGLPEKPNVIHATAGSVPVGVSNADAANTADLSVITAGVVTVTAGTGGLTSGGNVSVGANGTAVTATAASQSGTTPFAYTAATPVVGVVIADAADGADAYIQLKIA